MFIIFMCLILLVTITLPICYRLSIIQKDIEKITNKINNLTENIGEEDRKWNIYM